MKKDAKNLESKNVGAGYVNWSQMYEDLLEMVTEYLGETEHSGIEPHAGEVSSDTVVNVEEFTKIRKQVLRRDFLEYWDVANED